jgi:hypothetical protein
MPGSMVTQQGETPESFIEEGDDAAYESVREMRAFLRRTKGKLE